jgi:DinB superfamily
MPDASASDKEEVGMSPDHRRLLDQIRQAPAALQQAVAAVPAGAHDRPPRAGEWSVRETLIHLRNTTLMVHGLRIRRLLYETDPVFADYDEDAARQEDLGRDEPIERLARMIVHEHEQIAGLLDGLPDDRWTRQGRHPELGPMSVELLALRAAEHTVEHARQIADIARAL